MSRYSDPLFETSQHQLPTTCKFCGAEFCYLNQFTNNPGVTFECGTSWLPVSVYAKRTEPEWKRYEECGFVDEGSGI